MNTDIIRTNIELKSVFKQVAKDNGITLQKAYEIAMTLFIDTYSNQK